MKITEIIILAVLKILVTVFMVTIIIQCTSYLKRIAASLEKMAANQACIEDGPEDQ